MQIELDGEDYYPVEELNIVLDEHGKKNRRLKNMKKYAPLIFEACFIRNKGTNRIIAMTTLQTITGNLSGSVCGSGRI